MHIQWLALCVLLSLTTCKTASKSSEASSSQSGMNTSSNFTPSKPAKLEMCAAIRGNGNYVFAHWGALARVLESYGPIDGLAGGSSASATSFLYESVYMNPAVWDCTPSFGRCTERQAALRMAFLMKSMRDFVAVLGDRVDFGAAAQAVPKLIERFKDKEFLAAVSSGDLYKGISAGHRILSSPELGGVIDKKILGRLKEALTDSSKRKLVFAELKGAVAALSWNSDDPAILIQRGLIDFNELTKRIGIAGDFYAGKDPETVAQTKRLLDACTNKSEGVQWREIVSLPGPQELVSKPRNSINPWAVPELETKKQTCGDYYKTTLNSFFDRFNKANVEPKRLSDPVGGMIPTLAATSIFKDVEADNYLKHIYLLYMNGDPYKRGFSSDWIRFGYWGAQADLDKVSQNQKGFDDIKTERFESLGQVQWGEALRVGPQEPGLGSVLCNTEQGTTSKRGKWDSYSNLPEGQKCLRWSLGAWSDLYPVQALKNLGCERVVYVTRRDDEGDFIRGVVKLLTKDDAEWQVTDREMFDLDVPTSAAARGLASADATVCSDWNVIDATQLDCLGNDSYRAPVQTKDEFFLSLHGAGERGKRLKDGGFKIYEKAQSGPPIRGCMPGAVKPATPEKRANPCLRY